MIFWIIAGQGGSHFSFNETFWMAFIFYGGSWILWAFVLVNKVLSFFSVARLGLRYK